MTDATPMRRSVPASVPVELLQRRVARQMLARLEALPLARDPSCSPQAAERLRAAREQALARAAEQRRAQRRAPSVEPVPAWSETRGAGRGEQAAPPRWWAWLGSLLPLAALLAGLLGIQHSTQRAQIRAAAALDAQMLVDELPPSAYGDAGFVEFLTAEHRP